MKHLEIYAPLAEKTWYAGSQIRVEIVYVLKLLNPRSESQ